MLIGHLPLGYLSTKFLAARWTEIPNKKIFMLVGLFGSITPDLDMVYFYLFDNQQHHHHTYWTHIPFYWSIVLTLSFLIVQNIRKSYLPLLYIFSVNILLHLLADSIVGDIWWLSPFINKPYSLFTVPALYKPWWLNFIFHWSFLVEIVIIIIALHIFIKSKRNAWL